MTPRLLTADEIADIERFQVQRRKSPVPQDGWLYVAEIDRLLGHIYAAAAPVPAEQRELAEKMAGRIVDLIAEDADQPEAILLYHKQVTNIIVKELASALQEADWKSDFAELRKRRDTYGPDERADINCLLFEIGRLRELTSAPQEANLIRRKAFDDAIAVVKAIAKRWEGSIDKTWNEDLRPDLALDLAERVGAAGGIVIALEAARDTTRTDEKG